jgi:hypothetical protein
MSNRQIISNFFIIILATFVLCQCDSQSTTGHFAAGNTAGNSNPRPSDEAKIEGSVPDYEDIELTASNLDSFEMPKVKLVFSAKIIEFDELPDDVRKNIQSFWKESLNHFLNDKINKPPTVQVGIDNFDKWSDYFVKVQRDIQKSSIETPNGKRLIYNSEAQNILGFLNKTSLAIVSNKLK